MAAIAAEMPARMFAPSGWPRRNAEADRDDDQADRDDEQDPDQAVELALERRTAALRVAEPAGDPAELRRGPGRDDDALAAPADDARAGVGHRAAVGERRVRPGRCRVVSAPAPTRR